MIYKIVILNVVYCFYLVFANENRSAGFTGEKSVAKVLTHCGQSNDAIKCFKVEALKLSNRMLSEPSITIVDGLSLIPVETSQQEKSSEKSRQLDEKQMNYELENLSSSSLNARIFNNAKRFFETHTVQVNFPRMLANGLAETKAAFESRGKKYKKYLGPFVAALAIKGGILTMVYHSIAIIAGKALIIGKIALIISAIIGLKKLVQPANHEKTTYEIVKHPHVQQSHSYSGHGDFESEGGQYHRSLGSSDMLMQDRAYRGYRK